MDILIFSRIELFNVTGEVRANKKGYARKKERKKEGRKERKKERKKKFWGMKCGIQWKCCRNDNIRLSGPSC